MNIASTATAATTFVLAALTASATGCPGVPKEKGLYVWCNGNPDGLYYENSLHNRVPRFSLCLGPEHWSETGDETGGIDLDEWTNDTEDIDTLRSMCVQYCSSVSGEGLGNCEQSPGIQWQIENHDGIIVPDPLMLIDDPAHLECFLPKANLAPSPWETKVIPSGSSPAWPSNGQTFTLACDEFEMCADEFAVPVGVSLCYDDTTTLWGPGMGGADHLVTTSVGGRSSLTITITNPMSNPSSDSSHLEDGQVEYSAPGCGKLECPFYLANLTISNTSSTWALYSDELADEVYITDFTIQLRRPTLGVWNTSTGEFYLGQERIDIYVTGTLQIGSGSPMPETYLMTNTAAIFGQIGAGGEIEILDLIAEDSEFRIEADLDYDTAAGSPPMVDYGLDSAIQ